MRDRSTWALLFLSLGLPVIAAYSPGPRLVCQRGTDSHNVIRRIPARRGVSANGEQLYPVLLAEDKLVHRAAIINIAVTYRAMLERSYYLGAFVTGGAMRMIGSIIAQTILILRGRQTGISPAAILQLAFLGLVGGISNAAWYQFLDALMHRLGLAADNSQETPLHDVFIKTAVTFFVWAPVINSAYLLAMPLLRGEHISMALLNLRVQFWPVTLLEFVCFVPYNLFAFKAIPLPLRAAVQSCVAGAFSVGLALMA